jgi:hypothetical protein
MKNRITQFLPSLTFSSPFLTFLFPLFLTFLTLFVTNVATAQVPSYVPTNGLIGYWPFNGNANDVISATTPTLNSATQTTDRFGNTNSAYSFNGGQIIKYSGNSPLGQIGNSAQVFSINFWISGNLGNDNGVILGSFGWGYIVDVAGNKLHMQYVAPSGGIWQHAYSLSNINNGCWQMGTITKNGNTIKLYIDGQLNNTIVANYSFGSYNSTNCWFGSQGQDGGDFWTGKIDDIGLWNRELTQLEITNLFNLYNPILNFNAGNDVTACGTSTTLTAPTGYDSYVWSNGATTNTTTVTANGTYTCTVTQGGCSASDAVDVTLIDATISATDSIICAGETTTLSVPQGGTSNTACAVLPTNLQNGLVGYWPFCGNANDVSGNGNNGTANGATLTTDRFGNANSAYSFDGNDWIEIPNSNTIQNIQSLTISGWIKVNDWFISNGDPYFPILCKSNTESAQGKYTFVLSPNSAGVHLNAVQGIFPLSSTFQTNQWRFLSISINSVSSSFYLDGVLIQTINSGVNPNPVIENTSILIGKEMPGLIEYCIGNIDDLTIHNRILSASEIQQLYTLGQNTYLWSTGATTANISVTPTQTTTYTCTVTDANGNACTDSVTVFVPQIEATDLTICAGESITLSVSGINTTATPAACPTLPSNLQTGLVGYWPFCGNANDASGNGNNGTVNGATLTTDRFGNANSAYSFDGNSSKIIVSNSPSLEMGLSNYSLSAWVKTNSQNVINGRIISKGSSGCITGYMMRTGWPNSSKLYTENAYNSNCFVSNSSIASINNNQWRLVVVTIDRNVGVKFYIDGVLDSEYSVSSLNNISNGQDLFFGYNNLTNSVEPFSGEIDDISIHNRALSPTEIQQLYTLGQSTYLWSNGATTPTINVSPTNDTTYTCTVTTNGVTCTDSVTVVVNNPTINLGSDVTVCGTSTTLTAPTGFDTYSWSNGGTTNTTTVTENGTYTCTVTQGGCSASDAVDVTLVDATISATDSIICAGETTTLSVPQGGTSNTGCAALPTNLQNGLVGYWPFCGNANDASVSGNNGIGTNISFSADRFGNANRAVNFPNGNLNSEIVLQNPLNPSVFSFSLWVRPTQLRGIDFHTILSSIDQANPQSFANNFEIQISMPDTYNGIYASMGGNNQWQGSNFGANSIDINTWRHYVVSFDGTLAKAYFDGVLINSWTVTNFYNPTTVMSFGNRHNGPVYEFNFWGDLDDIAAYNRALTASEIQQLFTLGQTTYLWSNGATTPTINVSPATTTTYTCTVTTNGVSCTDTITVVVGNPVASITPNGIVEICQGQSIALTGNGGVSYLWNTGAPTQSITVNTEAVYTVTVTDANGCTDTESQLVKVNFLPNIGVNNASLCAGQSATLTATGGLSYVWSPATGLSATTGSTVTATPATSTLYTVTGTGANGCTNTATAAVTVNALPTATITPATATTFCQGGSVVLNANTGTGLTYQWFNNASAISGATSASYTATTSGSYTVVVTNASSCSSTSTATVVTVNALPTATITPVSATTFCQGGSVVLNANTGTGLTYQWFNNASAISGAISASYTATTNGSYTVVVTNASTCSSTSTATVVTVNTLPTATITPATATTFCQGGSVVLNANTGTGLSYQWFNNATAINGATAASYTATTSGSYTVVVTNASTCTSTSTAVVVTVNTLPTATITPATATTFCQGGSVVLNANTGAGLTYQWFNNATAISGATSASYTATMSGSYTVTVTNASTCSTTSTATVVTVNALPTATITPATATTFCQGGSVVLNANTGTGLSYQWRLNGNPISGATSSSYTANASGSYSVVVTNASTCSATSTATVVTVNALPVASISPNGLVEICQGQSIALTANGGVSYLWSTGAPTQSITVNTEALYTVTVTDINGCTDTESQFVKVNQLPNVAVNNASICLGQSAILTATGGLTYVWSPVTGLSATTGSTVSSSTTSTTVYTVIGTGANGCTNSATATVTVNALPTATITPATATTFCQGGSVVLNANTGAGLTYQWFNNTSAISGATSASYTATMSGSYTVTVTNASTCSSTSTPVDVTTIANVDYFADADGDGFGDAGTLVSTCVQPQGYVTDNTDCDDNDATVNTGATEVCNHIDDDCNGLIDDGITFNTYYADNDGDSFGDANNSIDECSQPAGYVTNNTDCNDNNANQNAASTEICNGEDDDCDGTIDNGLVFLDYYVDADGDGFGTGDVTSSCTDLGAGYTNNNTDCDDANSNTNPSATETCNTIDDNCDGQIDEGVQTVYFIDNDGDTYGNPSVSILACTQPVGYTPDDTDCNDTDASINPGAEDIGGNGIDENCDGEIDNSIFELNASINLYPNPTRSELNIQINNALVGNDMYIFDAVGKLVYKQQLLSTQTTLSMSEYADGNYIFRVGEVVKRFVVEK